MAGFHHLPLFCGFNLNFLQATRDRGEVIGYASHEQPPFAVDLKLWNSNDLGIVNEPEHLVNVRGARGDHRQPIESKGDSGGRR